MAIPFFVHKAGIIGAVIAFAFSFIVSVLLHMMIAEVLLTVKDNSNDILEGFNLYLFKGKLKPFLTVLDSAFFHIAGNSSYGESVSVYIGNGRDP